jgi:hypothetical protein
MKVVIKIIRDRAVVVWAGNNLPFVVCTLEHRDVKVGDTIPSWFHGHYFATIEEALYFINT